MLRYFVLRTSYYFEWLGSAGLPPGNGCEFIQFGPVLCVHKLCVPWVPLCIRRSVPILASMEFKPLRQRNAENLCTQYETKTARAMLTSDVNFNKTPKEVETLFASFLGERFVRWVPKAGTLMYLEVGVPSVSYRSHQSPADYLRFTTTLGFEPTVLLLF